MGNIQILDCTLRDGGYCNQWEFGFQQAKSIVNGLVEANIDIIECGFLTDRVDYHADYTRFNTLEQIRSILPEDKARKAFVCMMNYGEYNVEQIPEFDGSGINGIRVAFHKRDLDGAIEACRRIGEKGYDVYMQAMVSLSYSDDEFVDLILRCNEVKPKAFYIVDSFGCMKQKQMLHLVWLAEQNLAPDICLGFHSHNNMQMAYANAQSFVLMDAERKRIVDSSVFGMGRGAGNLNTELFAEFLNDTFEQIYEIKPMLRLIDEILNSFYQHNYWGYSLPNYLSAKHNAHPNYAGYFDDKKTMTIEDMDAVFALMDSSKKVSYDKEYAESLYLEYMGREAKYSRRSEELRDRIKGKTILVVAPGKSAELESERICAFAQNQDIISFSVNYQYPHCQMDYVFVSNLRRFQKLETCIYDKTISTSNITAPNTYLQVNYCELLNDIDSVRDNAGMMLIKYLISMGARKIVLAGMDGYRHDDEQNYAKRDMTYITRNDILDGMNEGMKTMLAIFSKQVEIQFLTQSQLDVM